MSTTQYSDTTPRLRFIAASLQYFLVVFAFGFVMGTIRVLLLEPEIGARYAGLLETPFMIAIIVYAARWAVRRNRLSRSFELIATGATAFSLLLATEFTVVLWLRGVTLAEYVESRDPITGAIYILMLVLCGLMPLHCGRAYYE